MAEASKIIKGWVLYDDTCGFCRTWVPKWQRFLESHGFLVCALQAEWLKDRTTLSTEELASEFRILLPDNRLINGSNAYRYILKNISWAKPLYFITLLPIAKQIFDFCYNKFAANRHKISKVCKLN